MNGYIQLPGSRSQTNSSKLYIIIGLSLIIGVILLFPNGSYESNPNILVIMADDLGWNDVSWHNAHMHTPNLEHLSHTNAAMLAQAYVNPLCSMHVIVKNSFLAGYYPFHMGTQQHLFSLGEPTGVPVKFKYFPQFLQEAGYKTYLVGKWHFGYCKKEYLPTSRGFDHFRGVHGDMDGSYATEVYTNDVKEYLESHEKSQPFFLLLAFQMPHGPLQVPQRYLKPCKHNDPSRRTYCGMVNAMDHSVGEVIDTLKQLGYYEDTIIIFTTHNGGDPRYGGNNYPLRGGKGSLWEGGTRAITFVHSQRYITHTGTREDLFSIVDWFPTILSMAGIQSVNYGDGINQWQMIQTGSAETKRTSLVYNIFPSGSAIRSGKYKLVVGDAGVVSSRIPPPDAGIGQNDNMPSNGVLMFDIDDDPEETKNIIDLVSPDLVSYMLKEIGDLLMEMTPLVHEQINPGGDPQLFNDTFACCWC